MSKKSIKMVKTKQTPRRSDAQGRLPPLSAPKEPDTRWGTKDKTFYRTLSLDTVATEKDRVSYKGKCIL